MKSVWSYLKLLLICLLQFGFGFENSLPRGQYVILENMQKAKRGTLIFKDNSLGAWDHMRHQVLKVAFLKWINLYPNMNN